MFLRLNKAIHATQRLAHNSINVKTCSTLVLLSGAGRKKLSYIPFFYSACLYSVVDSGNGLSWTWKSKEHRGFYLVSKTWSVCDGEAIPPSRKYFQGHPVLERCSWCLPHLVMSKMNHVLATVKEPDVAELCQRAGMKSERKKQYYDHPHR